jgi:hypothetical protein
VRVCVLRAFVSCVDSLAAFWTFFVNLGFESDEAKHKKLKQNTPNNSSKDTRAYLQQQARFSINERHFIIIAEREKTHHLRLEYESFYLFI